MLKPSEERIDYGKTLLPPPGFTCEFAVGTTYSLDLEALLGVPLALFLSDEMDGPLKETPVSLLEGIRRSSDRFALFCEGGQVKVPNKVNPVFSLLENSIFEVALANGKSFHPKVWVIKYTNDEDALYRVVVLSRNLTFDRSWDMAIVMEGKRQGRRTKKSSPLSDFLTFLQKYTTNRAKRKLIGDLVDELPYVHFETGDKRFAEYDFLPLGIGPEYSKFATGLFETYHELLIFSPFLSKEVIVQLDKQSLGSGSKTLITRKSEIPKLTNELILRFDTYCLKDTIVNGEEAISEQSYVEEGLQRQDIHAKLYVRSKYTHHLIYVGSANCSNNAFQGNIEFMLRLKYVKYGFRIGHILDDLFGRDGKQEDDRRNPFQKIDAIPVQATEERCVEDVLQNAIKLLCRAQSKAVVISHGSVFDVTITMDDRYIAKDVELSIASLGGGGKASLKGKTLLPNLQLMQLCEFYVITAIKGDETIQRVIKIPTDGIPQTRNGNIVKSVIKDQSTFLLYVSFLLSDDYLLSMLELNENKMSAGSYEGWNLHGYELPVLYESMLKVASRAPHKLKDIEDMMKLLQDKDIVPQDFEKLFQTFRKSVKRRPTQ